MWWGKDGGKSDGEVVAESEAVAEIVGGDGRSSDKVATGGQRKWWGQDGMVAGPRTVTELRFRPCN